VSGSRAVETDDAELGAEAAAPREACSVSAPGAGAMDGAAGVDAEEGAGLTGSTGPAAGAAPVAPVDAEVDVVLVSGWIETNLLSQIIRFGAYHHFVKNRLNWVTVSLVFGRMS
jgi:hypothetical protein